MASYLVVIYVFLCVMAYLVRTTQTHTYYIPAPIHASITCKILSALEPLAYMYIYDTVTLRP